MTRIRRILLGLALIAGLAFVAIGCESSTSDGHHWTRTGGTQTVVHVAVPDWADRVEVPVRTGIAQWNASPHLEVRLVRTCPAEPTNCVVFKPSADLPSPIVGYAQISANGLHILDGWIQFDSPCLASCTAATLQNLGCHEFGHTLGLYHGSSQGPCVNGVPTDHDFGLIAQYYSHLDGAVGSQVTSSKVMT